MLSIDKPVGETLIMNKEQHITSDVNILESNANASDFILE